ncbi:carbon dioxide concentrating mechanism protein, partial [filamentous cyanobacterium CCP5]
MAFFTLGELQNQYLVFGAVDIAPGAAIAPRSIVGADAASQLRIETGVCLGSEVVVQARWGTLTIEAGANIGCGALIIGQGIIGAGACIGAGSTLINPQIQPQQVIAPKSLVGASGPPEAGPLQTPQATEPQ